MNRKNKFIALLGVGAVAIWPMASEAGICPAGTYYVQIGSSYSCVKYPSTKGIKNSGQVGCEKTGVVCDPEQFNFAKQQIITKGQADEAPPQPFIVMTCAVPAGNNNLPKGLNIQTVYNTDITIGDFINVVPTTHITKKGPRYFDIVGVATNNPNNMVNLAHLCTQNSNNSSENGLHEVLDVVSCQTNVHISMLKQLDPDVPATVIDPVDKLSRDVSYDVQGCTLQVSQCTPDGSGPTLTYNQDGIIGVINPNTGLFESVPYNNCTAEATPRP